MDSESLRRIRVASRVLWYYTNINHDPVTLGDIDALRALAETEEQRSMPPDALACIVIQRIVGPIAKTEAA